MDGKANESNQGTGAQGTQTGKPTAAGNQGRTAATSSSTPATPNTAERGTSHTENGKSEKTVGLPHVTGSPQSNTLRGAEKPSIVAVRVPGTEEGKEDKPAPKKSHKKKPENKPASKSGQSIENLKLILQAVTDLLAMKVDPEWRMSEDELSQICNPLSNILARHDMTDKLNEYGDWIALLGACAMIIVPKMLLISSKKSKKKEVKLIANQSGTPTPGSGNVSPKPSQGNVQSTPPGGKQLPSALAAITAF